MQYDVKIDVHGSDKESQIDALLHVLPAMQMKCTN